MITVAAVTEGLKRILARPCIEVSTYRSPIRLLGLTRWVTGIQMTAEELRVIVDSVNRRPPCRLLVFGLGQDSLFWSRLNRGGTTVFVEDSDIWFEQVLRRYPHLKAYKVDYLTKRTEWRELLASPARLAMTLPYEIERERWDVIVVDAPAGFTDANPGRMKSIALATRLASQDADVLVHDCHRPVEQAYCDRFLKRDNLIEEVGCLRHYRISSEV